MAFIVIASNYKYYAISLFKIEQSFTTIRLIHNRNKMHMFSIYINNYDSAAPDTLL
jgi:uncharacterized membrane-anchored protein YitT (DUF2179 family)